MRPTRLLLTLLVAVPLSGCAFVRVPGVTTGTSRGGLSSSEKRSCHPSQYWDGTRCVHKGKGKGARKHDD